MKKIIALSLVLFLCFSLSACGRNDEVKIVQDMISLLREVAASGELTVDSEEAVITAEKAYDSLSDEDKTKIDNYGDLVIAREALDIALAEAEEAEYKERELEALKELQDSVVGRWINICAELNPDYYAEDCWTMTEDKLSTGAVIWADDELTEPLSVLGYTFFYDEDIPILTYENDDLGSSATYIREQDFQKYFEKYYVAVEVNSNNIANYISGFIRVGDALDSFGEKDPERGAYLFTSAVYEKGLTFVGSSDFLFECTFHDQGLNWDFDWESTYPYDFNLFYPWDLADFGRAKGTLYFVRSEYVQDNYLEVDPNGNAMRIIRLANGIHFFDWHVWNWCYSTADYNEWKY